MSSPRAVGVVLIVALGGFLVGFDGSLFTGATAIVRQSFGLTTFELGWTNSSQTLAATVAIFLAGQLAERVGRRTVLRGAALAFLCSAIVSALAPDMTLLLAGRLMSGFGIGGVLVAGPMYIAEIAPRAERGRMITFQQLFIVIGIALAFLSNYLVIVLARSGAAWIAVLHLDAWGWRWMVALGAVPALAYLLALLTVPESPRWLVRHERTEVALGVLVRVHGATAAAAELDEIRAASTREAVGSDATFRDLLAPQLRRVLGVGILVGVFQQVTGISSVLAYATVIFESTGPGAEVSFKQTAYVGLVNLACTVIALLLIDRVGRRPLVLFGLAGMALCLGLAAHGFGAGQAASNPTLVVAGLLGFVGCFAMSLGPIFWVVLSEIFPNRVRALAISWVGLVNSAICFLVQLLFPWQMQTFGGSITFALYGVFALVGLLLLLKVLPETRGRSLEALEESLVRQG